MTTTDYGPDAGVVWVGPPASWMQGRNHKVCFAVIHTTEGNPGPGQARNGHAYDVSRSDGVSTHCLHDSEESVQEVLRDDTAFAAFPEGNAGGIQHEQCGFSAGDWSSPVYQATMRRCALAVADDCKKYGLQPKHLSDDEMRAAYYHGGPGGIVGHGDITRVFPDPQADHTDPGPHFPWDQFIGLVNEFLGDDMNDYQNNALVDCLNILTGMANGLDEVPVHDKDGKLSLVPFYQRIASEVPAGGATLVPHTHAEGQTGPAVPAQP